MPGGRPAGAMGQNFNVGHLYGKILDEKTGKGIDGASVLLLAPKYDSSTKKMEPATVKAFITGSNGEFSLSDLSVMGNYTLRISAIGYKTIEQKTTFGIKMQPGGMQNREQLMSMIDKDLGNFSLKPDAANLGNVTVTATRQLFEMGVDRKIFNVDKNLTSVGQTATEVMKNIPSLSVDIDGNVTLRNATPQIFVDGRPTTMTLEQIPADIIDKVELITNPSAKFDASGGNAGILNIVLKKNRKVGYNGGLRSGVDSRGKINLGGDLNLRQNKLNFFISGMYGERKSKSTATTDRTDLVNGKAISRVNQVSKPVSEGYYGFLRGGFDYLIDNRNTITFSANGSKGSFGNIDYQRVDSTLIANPTFNIVNQNSDFAFKNLGTQLSFKHLFAKPGHEWTADANFNKSKNDNTSNIQTQTYNGTYQFKGLPVMQRSLGEGNTDNFIFQTDYANPLGEKKKLELGARASVRDFSNKNNQFFYNQDIRQYILSSRISSNYKFTDNVYAAYGTYSFAVSNWSYQLGLRTESSIYKGTTIGKSQSLADSAATFEVKFPLSLFPSVFVTHKLTDKQDLQFNYSRRVNRPNFWQLIPFPDYSDPYNLRVGNPGLKPEFTNSLEVSYNNSYQRSANFLASAYIKHNTNLITSYQYRGANPDTAGNYTTADSVVFNTFVNANNSLTFGLELTNRVPVTKWWDATLNFNLFNSRINIDDPKLANLSNQRTSWFAKTNNSFRFSKTLSVQLSGEYYAKTVLPQEGGRGGFRGGFGAANLGTAQGYINPRYAFDIAVRKDWTWKGGNSASLVISMNDFLRTQLYSMHSESPFLIQDSERRRDPQVLRVNFNYRFGKFDVNLLKRRNIREAGSGTEMMPN